MRYYKLLLTVTVGLLIVTLEMGCETARSPSADGASTETETPPVVNETRSDTIFVRRVGYIRKSELYDRFMSRDITVYDTYAYAEAVIETGDDGAIDSLLVFADRYPGDPRYYAVKVLLQERVPELGPWLEQHAGELDVSLWSEIGSALEHNGWRDSVVAHVLMEQVRSNPEKRSRSAAAQAFIGMGTLDEVRTIAAIGDTSTWKSMRWTAISAQARFDIPEFNRTVRAALRDTSRLHTRMLKGLEENHRHDFLPELRAVREQLQGTWPDYSMSYLDDLIAELEAKKAEGVKPGAPLDYPNNTPADSTSS